ncbi:hypothetical protein BDZ97DRAFT_904657 [Flammula alnicola]|nr:hypothetical protein BDZ97DRAFT_904657 [Flammula alnicola]
MTNRVIHGNCRRTDQRRSMALFFISNLHLHLPSPRRRSLKVGVSLSKDIGGRRGDRETEGRPWKRETHKVRPGAVRGDQNVSLSNFIMARHPQTAFDPRLPTDIDAAPIGPDDEPATATASDDDATMPWVQQRRRHDATIGNYHPPSFATSYPYRRAAAAWIGQPGRRTAHHSPRLGDVGLFSLVDEGPRM